MKAYEWLYIIGIFLVIIAIILYTFSITFIANPEENSVTNLFGKATEIDSNFTTESTLSAFQAKQRQGAKLFLWIGVPLGIGLFLLGLFIKRKKEGADVFIDDVIEDDEESNSFLF